MYTKEQEEIALKEYERLGCYKCRNPTVRISEQVYSLPLV